MNVIMKILENVGSFLQSEEMSFPVIGNSTLTNILKAKHDTFIPFTVSFNIVLYKVSIIRESVFFFPLYCCYG
jgi:hypothetical protein